MISAAVTTGPETQHKLVAGLVPLYRRGPSPARYPVSVETFVASMADHWTTLGNVLPDDLDAVWSRLCITLNSQILQHGTQEGVRWRVFPAELGTGKTEGLKLYASLLPTASHNAFDEPHPGVLIITRLKVQADEIARDINTRTAERTALAYYSGVDVPREELKNFPILVCTHSAFERGLEAVSLANVEGLAKWKHLHDWGLSGRKLTVIDESLDFIRPEFATLKNIRHLRSVVPDNLTMRHREAVAVLDEVVRVLSDFSARQPDRGAEREAQPVSLPAMVDLSPLWHDLRVNTQWPSTLIFGDPETIGSEEKARRKFFTRLALTVSGVQALLTQWNWYYKRHSDHTLTTARFLMPDEGINGAVILDATAEVDILYKLFDTRLEIVPLPKVRSYKNVVLFHSREAAVGKHAMVENADRVVQSAITDLQTHYQARLSERSVLFIAARDAVPTIKKWTENAGFGRVDAGWWQKLDGRNEWRDYDTVVILSLPFRDPAFAANVFQARFGPQSTEWLNKAELRQWRTYGDVLRAIESSYLIRTTGQALGRPRSRRVVDERGNCQRTDIFIRLPKDSTGGAILAGMRQLMPGLVVREWLRESDGSAPKLTPSYEAALLSYAETLEPGYHAAPRVREAIGAKERWWFSLAKLMSDPTAPLAKNLKALGVSYVKQQTGRVCRAYLHRQEAE